MCCAEDSFSAVSALGGARSLLSVVQGPKLFAVQTAGNNSIVRCSEQGEALAYTLYVLSQATLLRVLAKKRVLKYGNSAPAWSVSRKNVAHYLRSRIAEMLRGFCRTNCEWSGNNSSLRRSCSRPHHCRPRGKGRVCDSGRYSAAGRLLSSTTGVIPGPIQQPLLEFSTTSRSHRSPVRALTLYSGTVFSVRGSSFGLAFVTPYRPSGERRRVGLVAVMSKHITSPIQRVHVMWRRLLLMSSFSLCS